MEEKKALPLVIKFRCERILGKAIKTCYQSNEYLDVFECLMEDGSFRYVNLNLKKEINVTVLKVKVEDHDTKIKKQIGEKLLPKVDLDTSLFEDFPVPEKKTRTKKLIGEKKTVKKTKK